MIAKRVAFAVCGLVILSSGTYLFVYLYRWEWNRALIAGVIFVAAEIALATMLILERLRSIEERVSSRSGHSETMGHLKESAPAPKVRFKWLVDQDSDLNVFIPVLMGAGVIFSGVAWVVERLARATAKPALEHGLAVRLQPLALPEGGFLSPLHAPAPMRSLARARFKAVFYTFVFLSGTFAGIDALGDLTQNRPELDVITAESGTITLDITREGWARSDAVAAKSLWHACQQTVSPQFRARRFVGQGDGRVTMTVTPVPGASAERRLRGCLQDATLDNVLATVVSFGAATN